MFRAYTVHTNTVQGLAEAARCSTVNWGALYVLFFLWVLYDCMGLPKHVQVLLFFLAELEG